jgi:SAM-dependent methyltransferase
VRLVVRSIAVHTHRLLVDAARYAQWLVLRPTDVGTFVFAGREYRYFRHPHNATWQNERAVEVPIARTAVLEATGGRVLEIGNVLGHYMRHEHDVVDKYEAGANVQNVDVLAFEADEPYDLIVSVSTLEHVGWDEAERDPDKIPRAVERLRSLLAPGGRALVTLPVGYNPWLDDLLKAEALGFDEEHWLLRDGRTRWREVPHAEVGRPAYGTPYPAANGLVIGIIECG